MPIAIPLSRMALCGAGALLAWSVTSAACAREPGAPVRIDSSKVAQLKRLEPLTPEKVRIFLDSGQLDNHPVELVVKHIDKQGILSIPAANVGAEEPPLDTRSAARLEIPPLVEPPANATDIPRKPGGGLDVLSHIRQLDRQAPVALGERERRIVEARLAGFRTAGDGERETIKSALRAAVPGCNALIATAYADPVDLCAAASLWKSIAWPGNPRAAGYIAAAHQEAVRTAQPVLIAYAKDIGGLILRRKQGREQPLQRWYESRELRDLILDLEKSIAQCSGVRAATYLSAVFAARYRDPDAPMRDSDRDRKRIIQASGGDKEAFNSSDPKTWGSSLPPSERALIAERLLPHLRAEEGDLRDTARDGLLVVLGGPDKRLKDRLQNARKDWSAFERWYLQRREELLAGAP